jgi:hypothetical protein
MKLSSIGKNRPAAIQQSGGFAVDAKRRFFAFFYNMVFAWLRPRKSGQKRRPPGMPSPNLEFPRFEPMSRTVVVRHQSLVRANTVGDRRH